MARTVIRNKDVRMQTIVGLVFGKYDDIEYVIGRVRLDEKNGLFAASYIYENADKFVGWYKNITLAVNGVFDYWMEQGS